MRIRHEVIFRVALLGTAALLVGCGMPGPPQPPSLKLPKLVEDLDAQRTGQQVVLSWTGASTNTDKTNVETGATAIICRRASPQEGCEKIGTLPNKPGVTMEYSDTLPAELRAGEARVISYAVATENRHQRSAGWSRDAWVPAGEAAPDVINLVASSTARGVQLNWQTAGAAASGEIIFRIFRTRLTTAKPTSAKVATGAPGADKQAVKKKGLTTEEEPADQTLEVTAVTHTALDTHTAWGEQYSYRVQAVKKVRLETQRGLLRFELAGVISNPATVATKDVFPPAAPRGLAVVPVWADDDKPGMDLNWEPNTETQVAGYRVYRAVDVGSGFGGGEMISGADLLIAPTFADRGLTPGAKYQYWIVAVDAAGNASPRSASDREVALRTRE